MSDLEALIALVRAADGQPPFSDQSLVDLRTGASHLIEVESGVAIVSRPTAGPVEAEFVVEPDARGRGIGTSLLERIIADTLPGDSTGELLVWAHGDHPAARALASSHGLVAVRELLQLRTEVPASARSGASTGSANEIGPANGIGEPNEVGAGASTGSANEIGEPDEMVEPVSVVEPVETRFTPFVVGADEEAWVALNARVFAFHAEQGSVTVADLVELESEPWFDAGDFLLAKRGDELVGYCWLKVEHGLGEIYVIGVSGSQQGEGLGRKLMTAGFARLAARGIHTVALYVESDNDPAVALYRSLGFETYSVDVQYRLAH